MKIEVVKKTIDRIIEKLEDEAFDRGVDPMSDEFQETIEKVKDKLLKEKGFTIEDYSNVGKEDEEEIQKEIDNYDKKIEELKQTNQETNEKVLIQTERIKGLENLNNEQRESFKEKLELIKSELENTKELSLERKVLIQEDLINLNDKLDNISTNGTRDVQEIKEISKEQAQKQEQFNNENNLKHKEQEEDINLLADTVNKLWIKE